MHYDSVAQYSNYCMLTAEQYHACMPLSLIIPVADALDLIIHVHVRVLHARYSYMLYVISLAGQVIIHSQKSA